MDWQTWQVFDEYVEGLSGHSCWPSVQPLGINDCSQVVSTFCFNLQDVLELVEGEIAAEACQKDSALLRYFDASAKVVRRLADGSEK